ncbi:MAG: tetratricopeptide repeat protein [Rhodocyclaceae bacterium]
MKVRTRLMVIGVPALLSLAACQSLQTEGQTYRLAPAEQVRHGASRLEALYAIGRYQQGQRRYEAAAEAYTRLLALDPGHAEVRNALGVVLAGLGRNDAAVVELEKAVANAPRSASIRNNLGYAYLLQGKPGEAVKTLEIAAQLDPANLRVHDNLAMAKARGSEVHPAVASILDIARKTPPESPDTPSDGARLVPLAANVFALQLPALPLRPTMKGLPSTVGQPVVQGSTEVPIRQAGAIASVGPAKAQRLEVANGNGVTGLAREMSGLLESTGYAHVRKTNEIPYRMPATEIQYRPGFEPQARDLQTTLRRAIPLVASTQLRADVQVRLLLGKDARSVTELVAQAKPLPSATLAAAAID